MPLIPPHATGRPILPLPPLGALDARQNEQNYPERPSLYGAESAGPPQQRPPPLSPSHTRSSSNPLPKLFKRRGSLGWPKAGEQGDDQSVGPGPELEGGANESPGKTKGARRAGNDEPSKTAFCMCCGQKIKLPKDIKVFRCTACLTINDLVPCRPLDSRPRPSPGDAKDQRRDSSAPDSAQPASPISLERTQSIIDDCLSTYLKSKLDTSPAPTTAKDDTQSHFDQTRAPPTRAPPVAVPLPDHVPSQTTPDEYPPHPISSTASTPEETPAASIKTYLDWSLYTAGTGPPSQPVPKQSPSKHMPVAPSQVTQAAAARARPPPFNTQPIPVSARPQPGRQPTGNGNSRAAMPDQTQRSARYERAKLIFKPLEDLILRQYGRYESLNNSFSTSKPRPFGRTHSESAPPSAIPEPPSNSIPPGPDYVPQLDPKMLLVGDFAENGDWWTGRLDRQSSTYTEKRKARNDRRNGVNSKTPAIDWSRIDDWYAMILFPDRQWHDGNNAEQRSSTVPTPESKLDAKQQADVKADLLIARGHVQRSLFKVSEHLLRRPSKPLTEPEDVRFLLLLLSNPLLYPDCARSPKRRPSLDNENKQSPKFDVAQHAGILKRAFGLLAGSSETCHRYIISWFSRIQAHRFVSLVDLVASFINYRLTRRKSKAKAGNAMDNNGLIPDLSGSAMHTSAQLQAAAGLSGGLRLADDKGGGTVDYSEDWQLSVATKVMALLFTANNTWQTALDDDRLGNGENSINGRPRSNLRGQLLPTSDFYNSLLEQQDVIADFKKWESKKGIFSFCQYPFLLSLSAKIKILEHDARRQMEDKARETFFNNVISGRAQDINFHLHVRRDCVVGDSLQRISEAVGQLQGDLKKGIRVHFTGEDGVDAGGLRKEWFLLLVRDIFDPDHGLFLYDDDSRLCYFNPNSFETSDRYYMVGVLLGLAIYNSTILDVALPSFAFRKLLSSNPTSPAAASLATFRSPMTYTLDDLAEYRPALAQGLQALLDFDGDVQSTFLWNFVVPIERYGTIVNHSLVHHGEQQPVTNENRHEFVNLYVRHLLDTIVSRQFEPFKRGFFTVCAGNALSLFRAEEIELLIRGSDDTTVDVDALRAVAVYENFRHPVHPDQVLKEAEDVEANVPVVAWFWDYFARSDPREQRRLLQFITASDRVPATGAAGLVLRIVAGGDGMMSGAGGEENRFPIARTCFNSITLWGWGSKEVLGEKVGGAVRGSEGFGLK